MTLSGETELSTSIQGAVRNLKSAFVSAVTTEGRCGRMKCVGGGDGPDARSAKGKVLENSIDRKVRRPIADDGDLIYLIFCRRLRAHELTVPAHHRGKFAPMRPAIIMRSDHSKSRSRIARANFVASSCRRSIHQILDLWLFCSFASCFLRIRW